MAIRVGELRERVEVLTLAQTETGYAWQAEGSLWAKAEKTSAKNLFSSIGLGAPTVRFVLRARPLTLHQALRLRGQHCFLTDIAPLPENRLYLAVTAAVIEPIRCTVTRRTKTVDPETLRPTLQPAQTLEFPACCTEKYVKLTEGMPNDAVSRALVLVTPKAIGLRVGEVVRMGGEAYRVQTVHDLDPYKNEYEVLREEDA